MKHRLLKQVDMYLIKPEKARSAVLKAPSIGISFLCWISRERGIGASAVHLQILLTRAGDRRHETILVGGRQAA